MYQYFLIALIVAAGCSKVNPVSSPAPGSPGRIDTVYITQAAQELCEITIRANEINSYGSVGISIYENGRIIAQLPAQGRASCIDTILVAKSAKLEAKYLRSGFYQSVDTVAQCGMEWLIN